MEDTIVTLQFTDLGRARQALHALERADRDQRLRVRGATLIQRSGQGGIDEPAAARDDDGHYLPAGGSIGMLLELLAGPEGTVFGRPSEGFRGHGGPTPHEGERELALEEINVSLEPGVTVVIAEIADPDPEVLDSVLAPLGGHVTRRPARDIYAEIQAAADKAG
jgi:hypothetical protein